MTSNSGVVSENLCFYLVLGDADTGRVEAQKWRGEACEDVSEVTQVSNGLPDGRAVEMISRTQMRGN